MKKLIFTMAALSLASFGFAQDFGFGDAVGGSDDGSGSFEESGSPAVAISGEVGAETRAWGHRYDDAYDVSTTVLDASAYANLELNYEGDYTGANLKLKLNPETLKDYQEDIIDELYANGSFKDGRFQLRAGKMKEVWGKGDKVHVLDNFNANDYTDFIFPDYIDRRIGEVMFKATANLSWDYNLKLEGIFTPWMTADRFASSGYLYPYAQKNLTDTVTGIVKHNAAIDLKTSLDASNYGAIVDGLQTMSSFSADSLYEDNLRSLKYGQAGLRLTGTLGGIDWGASYYYGHYKQPTANLGKYIDSLSAGITNATTAYMTEQLTQYAKYAAGTDTNPGAFMAKYGTEVQSYMTEKYGAAILAGQISQADALQASADAIATAHAQEWYEDGTITVTDKFELPSLNYDQLQVFGIEAAFVVWKLNTRWEFAYNLTEDTAGDNPWIKNNSISWVAGFDIDIPLHNLNLNVQDNGTYILGSDKIKDAADDPTNLYGKYDTDYKKNGKYINNKIIALLSDKWMNEKLTTEVQGIYCIETKEFMVAPKIEYNVSEGLTFALRGVYLYSDDEDGEFYNFTATAEHNDRAFVQLTAKYQF